MSDEIESVTAREILDSRGNPTVEVEMSAAGVVARASCLREPAPGRARRWSTATAIRTVSAAKAYWRRCTASKRRSTRCCAEWMCANKRR